MSFLGQVKVSRAIASRDYDAAIDACRKMLDENQADYFAISTLAFCHEWKGEIGRAVFFADKILARYPKDLDMLLLSARYWSERGDEERTYRFACRAIENSAEKTPEIPRWLVWLVKPLAIFKTFKELEEKAMHDSRAFRKYRVEHLNWAHEYKTWYEWRQKSE